MMFSLCGAEHLSLCIKICFLLESQFQCSLTVLGERDEVQGLYLKVIGALVIGLAKVYLYGAALKFVWVCSCVVLAISSWVPRGFVCVGI